MRSKTRFSMRSKFTKELWVLWLDRLNGPDTADAQHRCLAQGIEEFRARCALKEKFPC